MNSLFLLSPFIIATVINLIALVIQIKSRRKFLSDMQEFNKKMALLEKIKSDIEKY